MFRFLHELIKLLLVCLSYCCDHVNSLSLCSHTAGPEAHSGDFSPTHQLSWWKQEGYLWWKELREPHAACLRLWRFCSLKYRACSSHCCRHRASCSRLRDNWSAAMRDRLDKWVDNVGRAMNVNYYQDKKTKNIFKVLLFKTGTSKLHMESQA